MKLLLLLACGREAELTPVAELPVATDEAPGRSWRRMNIDQLRASLIQVTGVGWTEVQDLGNGPEQVDLFEQLAGTLGKPDYLGATEEDLTTGLLFQKFLDDSGRAACAGLLEQERGRAPAERLLVRASSLEADPADDLAAARQDLADAMLRFHGRRVAPDDAELDVWLRLLQGSWDVTGDAAAAWRNVCVALVTHPDFYSY